MAEIPEPCEDQCIMILRDPMCEKCEAWFTYWGEIDSSEMDFDWSEYE